MTGSPLVSTVRNGVASVSAISALKSHLARPAGGAVSGPAIWRCRRRARAMTAAAVRLIIRTLSIAGIIGKSTTTRSGSSRYPTMTAPASARAGGCAANISTATSGQEKNTR